MAVIKHVASGKQLVVRERVLVGRSPRADIRLWGDGSSKEHASIGWDGAAWHLRDLSSRNGTRINAAPLAGSQRCLLPGDEIVFGDPAERWEWVDDAAPVPHAVREDGTRREMRDGLLLLPTDEEPRASLYLRDARWELDIDGAIMPVVDGQVVTVGGEPFRLELPNPDPASEATRTVVPALAHVQSALFTFFVSRDEEQVRVAVEVAGATFTLPNRSYHYMLVTLARERLRDTLAGMGGSEAGWISTDDLATALGTTNEKVNVDVHRARRLIAKLGAFAAPDTLIERCPERAELRLGSPHIQVHGMAELEER
jgi:hypothetical protein